MRRIVGTVIAAALIYISASCSDDEHDTTEPVAQLSGAWVGSTDQSLPMEFLVENNTVVLWIVGYRATGTTCTDEFPLIVFNRQLPYPPFPITNGVATLAVSGNRGTMSATGDFSETSASGTMTVNATECNGTLNTAWTATRTTTASANLSGTWTGTIKSNLISEHGSTLTLEQNGNHLTGSYTSDAGITGTIGGTIVGRFITFTLTQTNPNCLGTFSGHGAETTNPESIVLFFTGSDCFGAHTGGELRVAR